MECDLRTEGHPQLYSKFQMWDTLEPDSKNNYFKFDVSPSQIECFEGGWEYTQGQSP